MRLLNTTYIIPALALAFASCSTKDAPEYVEPPEDYCLTDLSWRHPVTVSIIDDDVLDAGMTINYESKADQMSRSIDEPRRRYVVKVFEPSTYKLVAEGVSFSKDITLSLPVGKLTVVVWADYTTKETPSDSYYFTDDWTELLLVDRFPYTANDYMKSAAWSRIDIALAYNQTYIEIPLTQIAGGFKLISTDAPNEKVESIDVCYNTAVPCAINGFSGEIAHTWSDCSFFGVTSTLANGDTQLCYDVLPVGNTGTNVSVSMTMRDADGRIVAHVNNIEIPVKPGKMTRVYAPFYSIREMHPSEVPGGGGVNINPGFNNEIVIEI